MSSLLLRFSHDRDCCAATTHDLSNSGRSSVISPNSVFSAFKTTEQEGDVPKVREVVKAETSDEIINKPEKIMDLI